MELDNEQVEVTRERVANFAIRIYEASAEEADACDPEYIVDGSEEVWSLTQPSRASAISYYASEMGIGFTEVRCTRAYMRVNRAAIRDAAVDLACELLDMGEDTASVPIANTWEGEGWLYENCDKKAPGAIPLWRCEAKPRTPTQPVSKDPQK